MIINSISLTKALIIKTSKYALITGIRMRMIPVVDYTNVIKKNNDREGKAHSINLLLNLIYKIS